jgi:hypothetical protein
MASYVGVDPGAKGSLCLLDDAGYIQFFEPPKPLESPANLIAELQTAISGRIPIHSAIEDVHSMAQMAAKSNFSFGRNVQLMHTILQLVPLKYELITPKIWQKALKIPPKKVFDSLGMSWKQGVAGVALKLYPNANLYGPKGGLKDGRADALMVAYYLKLKYGKQTNGSQINTT